nr:MAG TPA: hypothetical protein [Caudoviricetes sp.]DAV93225.1 MAG TPA: hypothetical protein [Caudoviricetes sp.]
MYTPAFYFLNFDILLPLILTIITFPSLTKDRLHICCISYIFRKA